METTAMAGGRQIAALSTVGPVPASLSRAFDTVPGSFDAHSPPALDRLSNQSYTREGHHAWKNRVEDRFTSEGFLRFQGFSLFD
jgi:hypothetical protein